MESKRSIKQPKLIYNNPVLLNVTEFLNSAEVVDLTTVIREVDENVETIPTNMIMYSDCTDLERLVRLPDLQQLNLEAGDNKESDCKMGLLYQLINLRNLWVNYTGIIDVSKLFQMRKLSFLYLKNCTLTGRFLPMHINALILENCTLSVQTIDSLANLEMLEELAIINLTINNGIFNTKLLRSFNNLTTLDLSGLGRLVSNKFLKDLTKLKKLKLYETTLEDYSPLTNLTELEDLNIKGNGNDSTEWINNMIKLVRLTLENFYVDDTILDKISEFRNLEELSLAETVITTTRYFPLLPKLKLLSLQYCDEIEEYYYLSECKSLESLALVGIRFPENVLSHLKDLKFLNSLNLFTDTTQVYDFRPLINNKTLEILALNEAKVDNNDMKIISTISNLEGLKIDNFHIDEDVRHFDDDGLEQLSKLKKIKLLIINGNPYITSKGILWLVKISDLITLNLTGCRLINYTIFGVLSTFPSLRRVTVDRFPEEDTSPLREANPNIIINMVDRDQEEVPVDDLEEIPPSNDEEPSDQEPLPERNILPYESSGDELIPFSSYRNGENLPSESEEEDFTPPKWTFNSK